MDALALLLVAVAYIGLLFVLAHVGDNVRREPRWLTRHGGLIYSLALAVYCTSWTYYGAVGRAARDGWHYLPVLLAPALVYLLGWRFLHKLLLVSKKQNINSIADFIASRYGKRRQIAGLVTLLAVVAIVPYIALQLKAVTNSFVIMVGDDLVRITPMVHDTALVVAGLMAVFAIYFGTRHVDPTEHHHGVILAIAFESVIKLLALAAIAVLAIYGVFGGWGDFVQAWDQLAVIKEPFATPIVTSNFATQFLLSAAAIVCLPRQFYVAVVQNTEHDHLRTARWVFPGYLIITTLLIAPITAGGLALFQPGGVNADTFVLNLPIALNQPTLSLLAFIGGISAATAMIIVATLALSTMISNDVVLPLLINRRQQDEPHQDFSSTLLFIRRTAIAGILFLAYLYHSVLADNVALASIGLLSFALIVQIAPSVVAALYWKGAHAKGVYWGLALGFGCWFYTLMLPTLAEARWLGMAIIEHGPWGIGWLRPTALFGVTGLDPLSHGVLMSLLANVLGFVIGSLRAEPHLIDKIQASVYVTPVDQDHPTYSPFRRITFNNQDLRVLLEQFLGPARTRQLLREFASQHELDIADNHLPDYKLVAYSERVLAGVIGSSSARALLNSMLAGRRLGLEEVVTFFDETTQALQQNQSLLFASLENINQGISVVDRDLNMVAWNRRYLEMYPYPPGMVKVGQPIEALIRYNAERGMCGPGKVEELVRRRVDHLKRGGPHRFRRERPDGLVIEIEGNPLPGGGFVTTFTDITEHVQAQRELQDAKDHLEQRVAERTQTIRRMNADLIKEIARRSQVEEQLKGAKAEAELANATKTRFLALASHDILQPLNAARLYNAALLENPDGQDRTTILRSLDQSLKSTETLINTLLEIAKLDEGAIQPKRQSVELARLLTELAGEFRIIAQEKGLQLRVVVSQLVVHSDPTYLRRILQNFLSNAIKYTNQGRVLVGARRRGDYVELQVWDEGPGISEGHRERIFEDFYRISARDDSVRGLGLGLAVAARFAKLLGHRINLRSHLGSGSCFTLLVPKGSQRGNTSEDTSAVAFGDELHGLRVLCIDDERENLLAMQALLESWGCVVFSAQSGELAEKILTEERLDIWLLDYQLGPDENGLAVLAKLKAQFGDTPAALVSASNDPAIREQARSEGVSFLPKPVKPARLKALLKHLAQPRSQVAES